MGALFRMIYCSRNAIAGRGMETEVAQILAASRCNNRRDGVTGALLVSPVGFAQVLEGPLPAVERTFERIQRDPRHAHVDILHASEAEARCFAGWAMACAGRSGAAPHPTGRDGREVLALLRRLVEREEEWAGASD